MKKYDVVLIGAGILGCLAARNLRRYRLSVLIMEKNPEPCCGITSANSAIIYPGYDNHPGSLKSRLSIAGNASYPKLCEELDVPFRRTGSLMVSHGPNGDRILQKKLQCGAELSIPGLKLLSGSEAHEIEPLLTTSVTSALYCDHTGTVSPWKLGLSALDNALENGAELMTKTQVRFISKSTDGYILETDSAAVECRAVINCAGMNADKIHELLFPPSVRIFWDASDYLVLSSNTPSPTHILFQERENQKKGITVIPTVDEVILAESAGRPVESEPRATSARGLDILKTDLKSLLPHTNISALLRTFAAVRPNPYYVALQNGVLIRSEKKITDFTILRPEPGFYSLIGIKTPGLTCADELMKRIALELSEQLQAETNLGFIPNRTVSVRKSGPMICQCRKVTEGEILDAIAHGAVSVNGIKHRSGACMGACQGTRCRVKIETMLSASATMEKHI